MASENVLKQKEEEVKNNEHLINYVKENLKTEKKQVKYTFIINKNSI